MKIDAEFKSIIPPLTAEEYAGLEASILQEGCRDALVVWNGIIVDGHNRYEICWKHGLPFNTVGMVFENKDKAKEWIILNQFGRRNLSAYDRSLLAVRLKNLFAEKAKKNQGARTDISQKSVKSVDTQKELAKIAGVSHDTIHKVEVIERKAPEEVKQKIKQGDLTINKAYQDVKRLEKREQIEQKIQEYQQTADTKSIDIYTTDRRYNIIYADPAWGYWEGGQKNQSLHYQTMTIDEICGLPVQRIADENCILFLWVTYPILRECFKVIEAWGFKYSTAGFIWVKRNKHVDSSFIGCGSWTRANSELCLIATKGNILRLDAGISQIIEAPIEEHSKKPRIARELITKLVGELPRIELFSRQNVPGWDRWGNAI